MEWERRAKSERERKKKPGPERRMGDLRNKQRNQKGHQGCPLNQLQPLLGPGREKLLARNCKDQLADSDVQEMLCPSALSFRNALSTSTCCHPKGLVKLAPNGIFFCKIFLDPSPPPGAWSANFLKYFQRLKMPMEPAGSWAPWLLDQSHHSQGSLREMGHTVKRAQLICGRL